MDYKQAGVDIEAGHEVVRRIRSLARGTFTPGVLSDIGSAVLLTSQRDLFARRGADANFLAIENAAWVTRTWGDGYGYLLVATGRAEIMVDPVCNPWDVAAMRPIMAESGGRFTDWNGVATCTSGEGVATNGKLHEQVLAHLAAN